MENNDGLWEIRRDVTAYVESKLDEGESFEEIFSTIRDEIETVEKLYYGVDKND